MIFAISLLFWGMITPTYQYPVLPAVAKQPAAFVPKGWHVLAKAEGDLNKDNLLDWAAVLEADQPVKSLKEYDNDQKPRILFVAFKQADGAYKLSVQSNEYVLLSNEGGIFGDPWDDLRIERGTLLVRFYGGSADRWAYAYRWRFQQNDWYLIGFTHTATSTVSNEFEQYDFNLSTGAAEHTVGQLLEDDNPKKVRPADKVRRFSIGKKPPFKLRGFKQGQTQLYKEVYI